MRGMGTARQKPEAPPTINIRGQQPKKEPVVPMAERIKGKDGACAARTARPTPLNASRPPHAPRFTLCAALEAAWIVWSGEEGVLWWASKIVRRRPCGLSARLCS